MEEIDLNREFAVSVVRQLREAGFRAYWAGGCVRDLLRGVTPQDYDVATDARPDDVRERFGKRKTIPVGESFGVIIVVGAKGVSPVEVATFRSEGPYLDGRRPESVRFSSPEEDAQRRDFTINGMFYDPIEDEILDYVGGRHDLAGRVVRAIGDAASRLDEDKLRLLRAVRFAAVLDFELEPQTAAAVAAKAPEIAVVSVERITQELKKMLVHPGRRRAIALCRDLGLVAAILPELTRQNEPTDATLDILAKLDRPSFPLALAVLLRSLRNPPMSHRVAETTPGTVWAVGRRLKLSNQELDDCCWLHARKKELITAHEYSNAELKILLAHRLCGDLIQWTRAEIEVRGLDCSGLDHVERKRAEWTPAEIDPPHLIDGHDILRLGVRAGPQVKEILTRIRTAQLNNELSTKDEAMALAAKLMTASS